MEIKFCPKCQGELKPVYRSVYSIYKVKGKNEYRTIDGAIVRPAEWLCEICKVTFKIEVVGIIC